MVCWQGGAAGGAGDASMVLHVRVDPAAFAEAAAAATIAENAEGRDGSGSEPPCPFRVVGWEPGRKGRMRPRRLDLGAWTDPARLIAQAADLNLKLMRWRALPSLDVPRLHAARVLLLGAGTLGPSTPSHPKKRNAPCVFIRAIRPP